MGIKRDRWWNGRTGEWVEGMTIHVPSPRRNTKSEYRFNKCKQCGRVLKSSIRPWRGKWYWHCYMCLNMQYYPK